MPASEYKLLDSATGQLVTVPAADVESAIAKSGGKLDYASPEQIERLTRLETHGSFEQQALGAVESVARTASFGLLAGSGPNADARAKTLAEESPVTSFGAQAAGSLIPGLGAGGAALRAARAVGTGARAAGFASAAAEGLASGGAAEVESAGLDDRPVSLGNILMFGVGGEIVGRALPKLLARGLRPLDKADSATAALAGEGAESALKNAEKRSLERAAKEGLDMPPGKARDEILADSADTQLDTAAQEVTDSLGRGVEQARKVIDDVPAGAYESLLPESAPAQTQWATATAQQLEQMAMPPGMSSKAGRTGKETAKTSSTVRRYNEQIAAYGEDPRFVDLVQQKAAETRRTPFQPGKERELWELQKDVLEENRTLFPAKVPKELGKNSPVDLTDMSHADLGADTFRPGVLEGLRADPEFAASGVPAMGKSSYKQHITLQQDTKGKPLFLVDGSHRLQVAREKGLTELPGIVKDKSGKEIYRGPIPIAKAPDAPSTKPGVPHGENASALLAASRALLDSSDGKGAFRAAVEAERALRDVAPDAAAVIRKGLRDKALFGRAAELRRELDRAGESLAKGSVPADAAATRAALAAGDTATGEASSGLRQAAEALDEVLSVAREWGLLKAPGLRALGSAVKTSRRGLGRADATHAARAGAAPGGAPGIGGELLETAVDIGLGAMGVPPVAGIARALLRRMGPRASAAIDGAARRFVRPLVADDTGAYRVALGVTALERFQGEYSSPAASFEAKRDVLEAARLNPSSLPLAIAESMPELAAEDPATFQGVAARIMSQVAYVDANLPPTLGVSLRYPRGIPHSDWDLREFAQLWNTTFDPSSALDDVAERKASPLQMKVLREQHPDIYGPLRTATIAYAANTFETLDLSTQLSIDLMFDADGLAGPAHSWRAAEYIQEAQEAERDRQGQRPRLPMAPVDTDEVAPEAASLKAIRSGVTNRGA
jgi:hypothetical protein